MPGKPAVRPSMRAQVDAITADVAQAVVVLQKSLRAIRENERALRFRGHTHAQREDLLRKSGPLARAVVDARAALDRVLIGDDL